jgi:hypothetical protein
VAQNNLYISKEKMRVIRFLLEHRKAKGERLLMAQIVNEIVGYGLEKYAEEYDIELPLNISMVERPKEKQR